MRIYGKLAKIPNPCITYPCLPGLVYVLTKNSQTYYLTKNNTFIWVEQIPPVINGDKIPLGTHLTITGTITEKKDIKGKKFTQLEIQQIID